MDIIKRTKIESIRDSPIPFLYMVKTYTPHGDPTIASFPVLEKPYLSYIANIWLKEKLLMIPKSRQMMASWLMVSLFLWEALVREGKYTFFQSRLEDAAGFGTRLSLLSRAQFIAENLPVIPDMVIHKKPPTIFFPQTNSTIHAVPQTSDAFRTYTASGILADEVAFQPEAEAAYTAARPTLDGGGRYTGLSSAYGKNFFWRTCYDQVKEK